MPTTPNWKLRRLAARCLRVHERHAAAAPVIGGYTTTLVPVVSDFIAAYDRLHVLDQSRSDEIAEGHESIKKLVDKSLGWLAQVVATGAIDGIKSGDFFRHPEVPDDVLRDAKRMLDLVRQQAEKDPESVPYAAALLEDVMPTYEAAEAEWTEAEGMRREHRSQIELVRDTAEKFNQILIGFRRSLARVIGKGHPDYQALRSMKIDRSQAEEDDEAVEPANTVDAPQVGEDELDLATPQEADESAA